MIYYRYIFDIDNFHVNKNEIELLVDSAMNNAIYHKKLSLLIQVTTAGIFFIERKRRDKKREMRLCHSFTCQRFVPFVCLLPSTCEF